MQRTKEIIVTILLSITLFIMSVVPFSAESIIADAAEGSQQSAANDESSIRLGMVFDSGNLQYKITAIEDNYCEVYVVGVTDIKCKDITIEDGSLLNDMHCKITGIGTEFASGCSKLKTITIKSKYITEMQPGAFSGIKSKYKLLVTKGMQKKYTQMVNDSKADHRMLYVGKTMTITTPAISKKAKVTWKTDNKKIAKIVKKGLKGSKGYAKVKGLKVGTVTLTASYKVKSKKKTYKCIITVSEMTSETPEPEQTATPAPTAIAYVMVPSIVGIDKSAAIIMLEGSGLKLGSVSAKHSDTIPIGQVISQSIEANTQVKVNTPIDIVISSGPTVTSKYVGTIIISDNPFADKSQSGKVKFVLSQDGKSKVVNDGEVLLNYYSFPVLISAEGWSESDGEITMYVNGVRYNAYKISFVYTVH